MKPAAFFIYSKSLKCQENSFLQCSFTFMIYQKVWTFLEAILGSLIWTSLRFSLIEMVARVLSFFSFATLLFLLKLLRCKCKEDMSTMLSWLRVRDVTVVFYNNLLHGSDGQFPEELLYWCPRVSLLWALADFKL